VQITKETNERLTQVGPGTPMGDAFRRYWWPACLTEEVPEPDGAPVRVRLLGEDLVAYRDTSGQVGLLDAYCAHRRAPMFYGRNEECGLRCLYHGWKYDTTGVCVDLPSEPSSSQLRAHVSMTAYPTFEAAGVVWTYMGPPDRQPAPPDYEWLRAPASHVRVSKTGEACNFLQAVEGGIDTVHSSFVHNEDIGSKKLLRNRDTHPRLEVDVRDHGFTYVSIRAVADDRSYLRVYQFMMPAQQFRGNLIDFEGNDAKLPSIDGHIWAPIDDENTYVYNWMCSVDDRYPISDEQWEDHERWLGRGAEAFRNGTYWLTADQANDYFIDRAVQKTKTFSGIKGINTQDFALQTGMGPIVDRSRETLGRTDIAVQTARRLYLEAADDVEQGRDPRGVDPESHREQRGADLMVPSGGDWRDSSKEATLARW
jgi:phthalate 4,5-dioxygenase